MRTVKSLILGVAMTLAVASQAHAQDVPPNCMVSFKVKETKFSVNISWALATGKSAAISCAAGEQLRERLFIAGDRILKDGDLTGTPAAAQQQALAEFERLERRVQQLPEKDVSGNIFAASGYLISKYELASCLLTLESAGGTCWLAVIEFLSGTYGFFQQIYADQNATLQKQEIIESLKRIKPALTAVRPGQADQAGARARFVETQTNLCRAIQKDCL